MKKMSIVVIIALISTMLLGGCDNIFDNNIFEDNDDSATVTLPGTLIIEGLESDSRVFFEGEGVEIGSNGMEIAPGEHEVLIFTPGRRFVAPVVTIESEETSTITYEAPAVDVLIDDDLSSYVAGQWLEDAKNDWNHFSHQVVTVGDIPWLKIDSSSDNPHNYYLFNIIENLQGGEFTVAFDVTGIAEGTDLNIFFKGLDTSGELNDISMDRGELWSEGFEWEEGDAEREHLREKLMDFSGFLFADAPYESTQSVLAIVAGRRLLIVVDDIILFDYDQNNPIVENFETFFIDAYPQDQSETAGYYHVRNVFVQAES